MLRSRSSSDLWVGLVEHFVDGLTVDIDRDVVRVNVLFDGGLGGTFGGQILIMGVGSIVERSLLHESWGG